jgi:Uma2 family endonuclease
MTIAYATLEPIAAPILIDGLSWREFKIVEQLLDRPGVRLSFLDGVLEIQTMPGRSHETAKERLGALVEIYLEFTGFDYTPTGSMTLENEEGSVKREADKSYELGIDSPPARLRQRPRPDLAIEIVITSGGLNKLIAYQRLQIPEVWFWEKSNLSIYSLQTDTYQKVEHSIILPNLSIVLLADCINIPNHIQALKTFRQSLVSLDD